MGTSAAEVLEEQCLGFSLSLIGTQRCRDCCPGVPTVFLIRCVGVLLFFSGCRLVVSVNLCVSRLLCDAPGPRIRTPNSCPTLLVHSPPMLAHFLSKIPLLLLWLQSSLACQSLCIKTSLRHTRSTHSDTKIISAFGSFEAVSSDACSLSRALFSAFAFSFIARNSNTPK